ncbi:unnamed protein product [Toxocara canis]|uniref:Phosphoinositide phospholipase C n=1 Tax=Toxocara canis TaxID=6265 RepID=A0A183UBP3_TOXCA|nr:unnamed protein product [Toxocara canis]
MWQIYRSSPLRSSLIKHGSRSRSPGSKNVSFSTQNQTKKVSNGDSQVIKSKSLERAMSDCLQIMQHGTEFIKLRANVRQFRRQFSLDADLSYIRWAPTNKKPHKARIAIDSIREIRVGRNTELFRATENCITDMQEECAFSVIHGDDYECLDLIAQTPEDANIWVTGLMALTSGHKGVLKVQHLSISFFGVAMIASQERNSEREHDGECYHFSLAVFRERLFSAACQPSGSLPLATLRESLIVASSTCRWLESVFNEADVDKSGYISDKCAVRLIRQINPRLQLNRVKHRVNEVSVLQPHENHRGRITRDQFVEIYKDVATRPEVYFLMVRYANKDYLSCQDLQLFLETEQGMVGVTRDICETIIEQYEPAPEAKENNFMTVDGFTSYLLCDECCLFDMLHRCVCHEMDHPFAHYFIAASHNTYLVEDQLKGPSSSDGYLSALKRNCRFIEIDVWEPCEAEGEDEPMIFHGGTLSSKLAVSSALKIISETAFERTRYPLLIRLEAHLSIKWQLVLVDLLNSILANRLYRPSEDPIDWTQGERLPTPKDFQMKIILIGKRLKRSEEESGEVSEEDESEEVCEKVRSARNVGSKMLLCKQLSDLMCPWAISVPLRELASASCGELSARRHLLSLRENDCLRMLHTYASEFTQVTKDFVTRVTPNSIRIDSSNLNPQEFWNFGVQLVALNYQTPGLMMDLQATSFFFLNLCEGKFSENGGCGYVLKPSMMRDDLFTPGDKLPFAPQILHLRVLSGQQLPRPRGSTAKGDSADPFVVIEIFGIPADCAEERTKTVRNDSVNPAFDESFQFQISVPELALVRFLVLDDDFIDDDFIGQYTAPFECLQSGYRHVPLLNNEGDPLENCTLFVHVAITNRRGGGVSSSFAIFLIIFFAL